MSKTPPRFRDPAKIFRDPSFSRYHSPPLIGSANLSSIESVCSQWNNFLFPRSGSSIVCYKAVFNVIIPPHGCKGEQHPCPLAKINDDPPILRVKMTDWTQSKTKQKRRKWLQPGSGPRSSNRSPSKIIHERVKILLEAMSG